VKRLIRNIKEIWNDASTSEKVLIIAALISFLIMVIIEHSGI
jgi:hypothetical protein